MTYEEVLSHFQVKKYGNRICEGDFGIAEYASPERAKEVLNDMFQKYAAGEKAYIMPEE